MNKIEKLTIRTYVDVFGIYYAQCWDPNMPSPDNFTNLQEFCTGTNLCFSDQDEDQLWRICGG